LDKIKNSTHVEAVGIDFTEGAVSDCKNKNIEAYCCDLYNIDVPIINESKYDYIVSFHVLEHLNNPIAYIQEMIKKLTKNGIIFLSTPLSPMSFETTWFDPLNNPPHHLTNWNIQSIKKMANLLNLELEVFLSPKRSFLNSLKIQLILSVFNKGKIVTISELFYLALKNPKAVLFIICKNLFNLIMRKQNLSDTVLMKLKIAKKEIYEN